MLLSLALVVAATSSVGLATSDGNFSYFAGTDVQQTVEPKSASELDYTLSGGQAFPNPYMFERIGTNGPVLMRSVNLIEQLSHFVRERTPERTVHAKGACAHGYFEVTTENGAKYSRADVFKKVGQRTSLTLRASTIAGNLGSPDNQRDLRGMGIKMRTEEGILDWVFLNHPVFWLRDPTKFPHFIRSQKRDPSTNVVNYNNFWDYLSNNNESTYQVMRTFTDLGTPYGYRHMATWSGNTYRVVKTDTDWHYAKFIAKPDQGVKNNTLQEAIVQQGINPDFGNSDLYGAIENGTFPSWTIYFQVMTKDQAEKYKYNVFDLTKEWIEEEVPLIEVGRITLNKNVDNHFAECEQIGFEPANMPPGIEASDDPTLQARLFIYGDAQRYRIGKNYKQLPINCPLNPVANYLRDGYMSFNNQGSRPNFVSTQGQDQMKLATPYYNVDNHTTWAGAAVRYVSQPSEIDFDLPRYYWNKLSTTDRDHLVYNIVAHLGQATDMRIKKEQSRIFKHVNAEFGSRVAAGLNITLN